MNFKIEPEFQDLIPLMSSEEYEMLEKSIIKDGCREPLIIWAGENILLDGHNRFKICLENKIKYKTMLMDFDDEDAAKAWMIDNQLSRRNLLPHDFKMLLGMRYKLAKKEPSEKGNQHTAIGKNYQKQNTAETIAKDHGVSEKTVRNAEKYVDDVQNLKSKIDNFKPQEHTQKEIKEAAEIIEENPEEAKEILNGKKEVKKEHEPALAMQYATMAISQLTRILPKDPDKQKALDKVEKWIEENR